MTATIPLSRGLSATVDADDFVFLSQWKWTAYAAYRTFYACRRQRSGDRYVLVLMHRALMCPPDGAVIDHINSDGTDNRRSNLRVCSQRQNQMNLRPQRGGTSLLKGVWMDNSRRNKKKWRSAIRVNGRLLYLGRFETEEGAAAAYAAAALEHFGEFARVTE